MDDAHKARLAQGRRDGAAVRAYLDYLEANKGRRGRRRLRQTAVDRLEVVLGALESAVSVERLKLIQERDDLRAELKRMDSNGQVEVLRAAFIEAAGRYAVSKGISRSTFREMGIDAATLTEAGIRRGASAPDSTPSVIH